LSLGHLSRQALSKFILSFVSHQPQGQKSIAAAAVDICGSAVLSQTQAKI